jgi:hypothetical protein
MNKRRYTEMEDIYEAYEWRLSELKLLEQA